MDEHEDDIEPEVDEDADIETEEFPILDDEDDVGDLNEDEDLDIDSDESEI